MFALLLWVLVIRLLYNIFWLSFGRLEFFRLRLLLVETLTFSFILCLRKREEIWERKEKVRRKLELSEAQVVA